MKFQNTDLSVHKGQIELSRCTVYISLMIVLTFFDRDEIMDCAIVRLLKKHQVGRCIGSRRLKDRTLTKEI